MLPRRLRRLPAYEIGSGLVVLEARGFRARLLGLALLREPPANHALLIPRCRSVHTFGMRFPLDLVWLDAGGRALRTDRAVRPGRIRRCVAASAVLERPATRTSSSSGFAISSARTTRPPADAGVCPPPPAG